MRVCTVVSQKEPKEAKTEERIKETKAEEPKPEVQSVLLDKAVIKSKPATYAESCGAKSIVPLKCSSVKVTNLSERKCRVPAQSRAQRTRSIHVHLNPFIYTRMHHLHPRIS